jgi:polyisoprenoid-binding protein YceI
VPSLFSRLIQTRRMRTNCSTRIVAWVLLTLSVAESGSAQQITVDLDPAKTTITFVLGDVLHTVRGTFRLKAGSIQMDPAAKRISGTMAIDAASGDSGGGTRDKRMKREILEVERYPEITFTPTEIEGLSSVAQSSQATVSGLFGILGQQHAISFPVHIERSGTDVTAKGSFVVPYVKWGIKDPSTFILRVSKEVDVSVVAVGHIR